MSFNAFEVKEIKHHVTIETVFFFDMDGTLVNTDVSNFLSYKKAIFFVKKSDYGLTYNSEQRFNRSLLKSVIGELSNFELERIIKKKKEFYNHFLSDTELNLDVLQVLIKFSKTNKMVLVTRSEKDRAVTILKYYGLTKYFNYIFCREAEDQGSKMNKYEKAISKLGISPSLVIAFENEESEIKDAKNVGIGKIIKI